MPDTIGEAWVKVVAKVDDFGSQVEKQVGGTLTKVGDKLSSVGMKMSTFVTAPALAGGAAMFKMAADAEDATSAMNVVFDKQASVIEKWSKSAATGMGMTSAEAKKAATDMAIMGKAGDLAGKDLTDFATEQSQLSADLASFKGTSVEEAMTAIGAAYRGEMEPIRQYGVLLDQQKITDEAVALGLVKEGEELTNNAKLMATRSLVMKATVDQQGDFARTSDGAANKMKILSAQLKEQATSIGVQLLPLGQKLLGFLGGLLEKFNGLSPGVRSFLLTLGGIAIAMGPVLLVGGKLLSSFKMISLGFRALALIFTYNPFLLVIAAIVALVVIVVKNWDTIKAAIGAAWEWIKATGEAIWNAISGFLSAIWNAIAGAAVAVWEGIKAFFSGILNFYKVIFETVWNGIKAFLTGVWEGIKIVATAVWNGIKAFFQGVLDGVRVIFTSVWNGIRDFVVGLWNGIKNTASSVFNGIRDTIVGAINAARDGISRAVDAVVGFFTRLWEKAAYYVRKVKEAIQSLPFVPGSPIPMVTWAEQTLKGMNKAFDKFPTPEMDWRPRANLGITRAMPALAGAGGGGSSVVVLQLDGRELGRVVTPYITDEQIVTGKRTQVGIFGGFA